MKSKQQETRLAGIREQFGIEPVDLVPVATGLHDKTKSWTKSNRYLAIKGRESDHVHAVIGTDYRLVRHEDGIDRVIRSIEANKDFLGKYTPRINTSECGGWLEARFIFDEHSIDIGRGDPATPELVYRNSYNGRMSEILDFGAYRLVCSNGLVIGKTFFRMRRIHVGTDHEEFARDGLERGIQAFMAATEDWKSWRRRDVSMCELDSGLNAFGPRLRSEAITEIDKGKAVTLWLFYNVLTALVTHRIASIQRRITATTALRHAIRNW